MDIGFKERLTGALILVALVVVLVPAILNGPADRDAGAGPAAGGPPLRSYSMELGADAGREAPDQSALAPQNSQAPESAVVTAATEVPPAEASPVAQAPPPQTTAPLPAPPPVESAPPAPKPVPAATKAATASPSTTSPETTLPATSEQPVPAGSWWVQLGSFSQSANAQRLVKQLAAKGFRARVSPVKTKGKELFRVRAGPVGDRAAAEALQARLAAAGHKGTLAGP